MHANLFMVLWLERRRRPVPVVFPVLTALATPQRKAAESDSVYTIMLLARSRKKSPLLVAPVLFLLNTIVDTGFVPLFLHWTWKMMIVEKITWKLLQPKCL